MLGSLQHDIEEGKKMNPVKAIADLTVKETICLLEQSPEQLQKTSYVRSGLIIHLAVLYYKTGPFLSSDTEGHKQAEDFLEFLSREGIEADKRLTAAVYIK